MTSTQAPARPVVILLPGMLCDRRLWDLIRSDLNAVADVHEVELNGDSIDAMAHSVLDLPFPWFALVGLSLGGIVAMRLMEIAPERVSRLALLSTTAGPPRPDQHAGWDQMAQRTASGKFDSITRDTLLPLLVNSAHQGGRSAQQTIIEMAQSIGPQRFLDQLSAQHSRTDLRPGLAKIHCPVLVCVGEDDALARADVQQAMASRIPGSHVQVIRDCGHLSTLEQPREVFRALREWLGR